MRLFRTVLRHNSRPTQATHLRVGSARADGLEDTISADDASMLAWRSDVSGHARTVVVPLFNPDTATDLLRVARGLLPAQGGRLHALLIHVGDAEAERTSDVSEGLRELVDVMADRLSGCDVTFRTRSSSSVARGILDAIRDTGADAVVLGIRQRDAEVEDASDLEPDPAVESVIETATCDVVVFRPGVGDLTAVERILVPVDAGLPARNAVRVATWLRHGLHAALQLIHVRATGISDQQAHTRVARTAAGLVAEPHVDLNIVTDEDVVDGLVAIVDPTDLVVVGVGHSDRAQRLAQGSVVPGLLERLDVPILAVTRGPHRSGLHERLRRVAAWLRPSLTDVEQDTLRSLADTSAGIRLDSLVMTLLSGVIVTFGLLLDSAAVVIGALLLAPLMGPLQAFGIAVVIGRVTVALRSMGTIMLGAGVIVVFAMLGGLAIGVSIPTAEMLARSEPTLLDAVVALAAGAAGAYATARRGIPAGIAGVAIAAEIVPPVGTIGLGLAAGRLSLAAGATLLFLVNVACIAVVTALVFQWLGMRSDEDHSRRGRGRLALAVGSIGLLVVLLGALVVVGARRVRVDERPLEERLAAEGFDVDLVAVEVVDNGPPRSIRVVVDVLDLAAVDRERLPGVVREELADQVGDEVEARLVLRDVVQAQ